MFAQTIPTGAQPTRECCSRRLQPDQRFQHPTRRRQSRSIRLTDDRTDSGELSDPRVGFLAGGRPADLDEGQPAKLGRPRLPVTGTAEDCIDDPPAIGEAHVDRGQPVG